MSRPPIPAALERRVKMEAGFECAIPSCKRTPIEVAHIIPFETVRKHEFHNLIALCPNHHTRYDRGEIDRKSMRLYKAALSRGDFDPDIHPGLWTPVASMASPRSYHAAAVTTAGVLVSGGNGLGTILASAELYDSDADTWSPTTAMSDCRHRHAMCRLTDGNVLVTGGVGNDGVTLATCEIYETSNRTWKSIAQLGQPRFAHTMCVIDDDLILVAGGAVFAGGGSRPLASAEILDVRTMEWHPAGDMLQARFDHTSLAYLKQVIVCGGYSNDGPIRSVEAWNQSQSMWTTLSDMAYSRFTHQTLKIEREVLCVGGYGTEAEESRPSVVLKSAEIYDVEEDAWQVTGDMHEAHQYFVGAVLGSGRVLITGGVSDQPNLILATAEQYDGARRRWFSAGRMATARSGHAAALLPGGEVLVVGGQNLTGSLASAELYTAATPTT